MQARLLTNYSCAAVFSDLLFHNAPASSTVVKSESYAPHMAAFVLKASQFNLALIRGNDYDMQKSGFPIMHTRDM
jgi:hypothetical protein